MVNERKGTHKKGGVGGVPAHASARGRQESSYRGVRAELDDPLGPLERDHRVPLAPEQERGHPVPRPLRQDLVAPRKLLLLPLLLPVFLLLLLELPAADRLLV